MPPGPPLTPLRVLAAIGVALVAATLAAWALLTLESARSGVRIERTVLPGGLPLSVYQPVAAAPADRRPAVVLAHGFAGSQQLMRPGAIALARAGMVALTFDFPGHGRNAQPLPGSLREHDALLASLLGALEQAAAHARALPFADGRVAVLGHSMASDLVVRHALAYPDTIATIGVSLVYGGAPRQAPPNLLAIYGSLEPDALQAFARRLIAGDADPDSVRPNTTYGRFEDGSARRLVLAERAEHIGVLYSAQALREVRDWLRAAFAARPVAAPPATAPDTDTTQALADSQPRTATTPVPEGRLAAEPALPAYGLPLLVLLAALVALGWPLAQVAHATLAPTSARRRFFEADSRTLFADSARVARSRRLWWLVALTPALLTPLMLSIVPSGMVSVLVADHLLLHFLLYGLLTFSGLLVLVRGGHLPRPALAPPSPRVLFVAAGLIGYATLACGLAIDRYGFNLAPADGRGLLILALGTATLAWFVSEAWLATATSAPRAAGVVTRTAFLLSLALSVALDFRGLFFLLIILPAILALFLVQGLLARWSTQATGRAWIGALGGAIAFAWAIAVTFPAVRA
ncbi:MAG: alpha/beta fold hydrolase [Pseudomonadota bacterium]